MDFAAVESTIEKRLSESEKTYNENKRYVHSCNNNNTTTDMNDDNS